jgi:branched-chain amino acid transport system substrate-binding protein
MATSALAAGLAILPARAAEKSYEIHVITSLTGGASFLGAAEKKGIELVEKAINESGGLQKTPIHFVFHDDQTRPQVAVQLANQIIAGKPAVMLGPTLVATCNAVAPLAANGPVMYCFSPGIHPAKGSYVFTANVSTLDLVNALVRYYRMKGWTKIAVMTSTDASGQDAERGINSVLALPENKGITVVARVHFNTTDVSVSAQIEEVKASGAQALIAWSTGAPIGTIFRAIQQAGLNIPVGTTDGNMTYAQMKRYASFLPKQLYFPAGQWVIGSNSGNFKLDAPVAEAQKVFYTTLRQGGVEPDLPNGLGWEPAMVVANALRKLGTGATATQIRDYIGQLKGYAGVDGVYDFTAQPQRGLNLDDTVVTRWNAGMKRWQVMSEKRGTPLP